MKFSNSIVCLFAAEALAEGFNFQSFDQQPLLGKFNSPVLSKAATLLEEASKNFGLPLEQLGDDIKALWSEMSLKFPQTVSSLTFTTESNNKKNTKKTFDFHVADADFPDHKLRAKKVDPTKLGIDTNVKQYSGYLDIEDEDKHFFYWFFESRNDPKNDPIVLWLNGGPGCSSLTGMFFELGPASITAKLVPEFNPYSWTNNASVIFLDQPVNVGYSYSSNDVTDTVAAGKDVYAFLKLFFKQFPEYADLDFHIAGESYAGHYIPVFAAEILEHDAGKKGGINLKSVLIGNGLTDPLTQYEYYQPMACGKGGHPSVLSEEECESMLETEPRCLNLIKSCYETESVWSCVPAAIYCNNQAFGPYQKTGLNVYDIREKCESGGLCYKQMEWVEDYLNQDYVKEALGVEVDSYASCNMDINRNFLFAGDWMKPYYTRVIELLDKYDLAVIIYAGDKDFICNWLGNHGWSDKLPYSKNKQFAKEKLHKFITTNGDYAGEVKNFDKFTFLRLFEGGHMVPFDQPEASLDFYNRWLSGEYALSG